MEKTLITWTIPNMVTIWLMLAVGLALVALVGQAVQNWMPSGQAPSSSTGGY